MSPIKGLLAGTKTSTRHSTVTKYSTPVILAAKKIDAVSKIVLGPLANVGSGKKRLKFIEIPAGFRVTVRGVSDQQTLFIYTKDRTETQHKLQRAWDSLKF